MIEEDQKAICVSSSKSQLKSSIDINNTLVYLQRACTACSYVNCTAQQWKLKYVHILSLFYELRSAINVI